MSNSCEDEPKKLHQCKTCPWKVGAKPEEEIPGYDRKLHVGLKDTIAGDGTDSLVRAFSGSLRIMACHYSKDGDEIPCAGWLENQVGPGNNLGIRMGVMTGRLPVPVTEGEQHPSFEATLSDAPTKVGRRRAR